MKFQTLARKVSELKLAWALATLGSLLAPQEASAAACMVKPRTVSASVTTFVPMIAPDAEVGAYLQQGFRLATCPKSKEQYQAIVEQICSGAPAQGARLAIDVVAWYGRSRVQVCASARAGMLEGGQ